MTFCRGNVDRLAQPDIFYAVNTWPAMRAAAHLARTRERFTEQHRRRFGRNYTARAPNSTARRCKMAKQGAPRAKTGLTLPTQAPPVDASHALKQHRFLLVKVPGTGACGLGGRGLADEGVTKKDRTREQTTRAFRGMVWGGAQGRGENRREAAVSWPAWQGVESGAEERGWPVQAGSHHHQASSREQAGDASGGQAAVGH